ncbi:ATG6 [Mytilus edulis]|uniref:BECN n=1 Tax=Mytilus edulis TaxID=6550 RepID=A0A8S3U854_MYTED|nr:ATG6 [Mytilus edulis]
MKKVYSSDQITLLIPDVVSYYLLLLMIPLMKCELHFRAIFVCLHYFLGSTSCQAVCLTWKTENSSLVLICKVDALNFAITFFGPRKNETGFCLPYAPCHSLLDKADIEKIKLNDTTDEIIFKIPLNMQLNGLWTCQYGDKNHEAVTKVTLQDIPSNMINGKIE